LKTLVVWTSGKTTGILAQEARRKYVFAYSAGAADAVSLTMPVRLEGWTTPDLHPIFQMNIPEGALLEAIRRALAKIVGDDDFSILQATGGNQIGRNRYTLPGEEAPDGNRRPESLEELLTYPDTEELFHELIKRYALRSGVSGVQPKVLLEAKQRNTLAGEGYIVKSWGNEYPHLAANEFFCMTAARAAGLTVPDFHLAENGGLFVMRRFDRDPDGDPLGFEDMCSLQALGTSQKYRGTYERIAKSLKNFVSGQHLPEARRQFFATLVLSSMVRNGDAHLKNFGVLYPSPKGPVAIAPVYDIVTTTAYIKNDVPALSLEGTKKWWPRKILERFAIAYLDLPVRDTKEIISRVANAVMETRLEIPRYARNRPVFQEVGNRMMQEWEQGVKTFFPEVSIACSRSDFREFESE
jgi:serine/threonine-protein kinase HipA